MAHRSDQRDHGLLVRAHQTPSSLRNLSRADATRAERFGAPCHPLAFTGESASAAIAWDRRWGVGLRLWVEREGRAVLGDKPTQVLIEAVTEDLHPRRYRTRREGGR